MTQRGLVVATLLVSYAAVVLVGFAYLADPLLAPPLAPVEFQLVPGGPLTPQMIEGWPALSSPTV